MKLVLLAVWMCLLVMPAFAKNDGRDDDQGQYTRWHHGDHQGAPAPLIGAGIPVLMAAGGGLLGWKVLKRK